MRRWISSSCCLSVSACTAQRRQFFVGAGREPRHHRSSRRSSHLPRRAAAVSRASRHDWASSDPHGPLPGAGGGGGRGRSAAPASPPCDRAQAAVEGRRHTPLPPLAASVGGNTASSVRSSASRTGRGLVPSRRRPNCSGGSLGSVVNALAVLEPRGLSAVAAAESAGARRSLLRPMRSPSK